MNNLLKIVLSLVVLLFIYLGIVTTYKSCGSDTDFEETGLVVDGDEEEFDIFDSGEETGEVDPNEGEQEDNAEESNDSGIDYSDIDEELEKPLSEEEIKERVKKEEKPTVKRQPPTTTANKKPIKKQPIRKTTQVVNDGTGKYMVVAGSYLVLENAEKVVSRLQAKGYDQAEIVQFDGNKYHTVCAYRSDDYDMATSKSSALKRSGIDSYVHTRQ